MVNDGRRAAQFPGTATEVGVAFLKLGLTSFGGPIAHLAYFRREFVEHRRWLDERHYGQMLALCQFLPGPASSQLVFAIGLLRARWLGAIAAFVAFTLPSALLLFAFATFSGELSGPSGNAVVHGLKLVAVVVVAQGVVGMARTLTPDRPRRLLAALAAGLVIVTGSVWMQLAIVAGSAIIGPWLCKSVAAHDGESFSIHYGRRTGGLFLLTFAALLLSAFAIAPHLPPLGQVAGGFFRAGALVFGGGHVVLPLLKQAVVDPGWLSNDVFLTGYGAAQAVPGPMFTLSAFLGERLQGGHGGVAGAAISLLSIFLPGMLLVAGTLPFWQSLASRNSAARVLAGVNAAMVGLLAAAFYNPVWISAVHDLGDAAISLIGFLLLVVARWRAVMIVGWCIVASLIRTGYTG